MIPNYTIIKELEKRANEFKPAIEVYQITALNPCGAFKVELNGHVLLSAELEDPIMLKNPKVGDYVLYVTCQHPGFKFVYSCGYFDVISKEIAEKNLLN